MQLERMVDVVDRFDWLDPLADTVRGLVHNAYQAGGAAGQQVKNFMHGTWLGHPLHPVLTDLPVGAWSAAAVFDLLEGSGRRELGPGADGAVALGVVAGVAAALAGLTDWQHLRTPRRSRLGLLHGLLNVTATTLYATSLVCRSQGQRGAGRGLAYAGYGILTLSAYLGGHLVYNEEVGVDHAGEVKLPEEWTPVLAQEALAEGQLQRAQAGDAALLLVRQNGRIFAIANTCSHLGCSLAEGRLEGDSVRCSCHGSRFALEDGRVLDGPSAFSQPYCDTRVRAGQIEVRQARTDI